MTVGVIRFKGRKNSEDALEIESVASSKLDVNSV